VGVEPASLSPGDPITHGSSRFDQVHYRDPNPAFGVNSFGDALDVRNAVRIVW
jgi:hypothetical protein